MSNDKPDRVKVLRKAVREGYRLCPKDAKFLLAERDKAKDRIAELGAENRRLLEALEPFANHNKCVLKEFEDDDFVSDTGFKAGDFRRAAEALGKEK